MSESSISVPISTAQFLGLVDFLREQGSNRDPVSAVEVAIDYWIDNASWKQEDLLPEIFTKDKGYTWKEVFLPHATSIRMRYKGQYHYCQVDGDEVLFNEQSVSPSEFANKVAGSNRNAWRDLEIRRPGDEEWIPADQLRTAAKKARM
jgi:hypothetical protein